MLPLAHTSLMCGIQDCFNVMKLAPFPLYWLICLEGGPVVCPPSESLSSEDIKSRALSMLSKALAFSLSCAGRFALLTK